MGWWRETIDIVKENDPAARTSLEVLLTYPGVKALAAHRVSHFLWNHGFKLLARMHSQFWRFWTQIEIHPGATIASGVFIDHGAGLVIGETAVVEKGVMLYHGVTLGGTGKDTGKRHPTVKEGALVSAHAQVIGPIEIGANPRLEQVPSSFLMCRVMSLLWGFRLKLFVFTARRMNRLFTKKRKNGNTMFKSLNTVKKKVTSLLISRTLHE